MDGILSLRKQKELDGEGLLRESGRRKKEMRKEKTTRPGFAGRQTITGRTIEYSCNSSI